MKPNYICPRCSQQFSRRWNLRQHCRTQHNNYDPFPIVDDPKHTFFHGRAKNETGSSPQHPQLAPETAYGLKIATERLRKVVVDSLKLQGLARGDPVDLHIIGPMKPADYVIDYMLDKFVIVNKENIFGISGYTCYNCLTFQFQYINDIACDLTAKEKHRCKESKLVQLNKLLYQDKPLIQNQLYSESIRNLVDLTNSLFPFKKCLVANSSIRGFQPNESRWHAPIFSLNSMQPDHWACSPIRDGQIDLTDSDLENIVGHFGGTYGIFSIPSGEYMGTHLLYITSKR